MKWYTENILGPRFIAQLRKKFLERKYFKSNDCHREGRTKNAWDCAVSLARVTVLKIGTVSHKGVCVCGRGRIDFAIKNCNSIRSEWSVISMSPYGVCVLCIIKAACIRTISKPLPEAGLGRLVCLSSAALSTCKVQTRLRNSRRYEHFVNRCCYVGLIARTVSIENQDRCTIGIISKTT